MTYLVLTDHGTYLSKSKERFKLTFGSSTKPLTYVAANRVEGIIIDAKTTLSSGAFDLINHHSIPVIWKNYSNDGMILLPFNNHGSVDVRRAQYDAINDERGVVVATKFAYASMFNKLMMLKRIQRNALSYTDTYKEYVNLIEQIIQDMGTDEYEAEVLDVPFRQHLMNYEARVAKIYYEGLNEVLFNFDMGFEKRTRRPATDPFSALLNYSYAVLKGQLTESIAISGLDIYAGFLHTDRSGRESLILDMIEEFRQPVIDEVLLKLVMEGRIHPGYFEESDDGIEITKKCKKVLLPAIFERLKQRFGQRSVRKWMIYQARSLSNFLRYQEEIYAPFRLSVTAVW